MANRSLGTLTLNLIAEIGGFAKGMDKAERRAEKWRREVKKSVDAAGKAFAAGATVVTGALAAMTVSAANNAKEIENLAGVANTGAEDFQRYAYAAKSVGVEQDKLADIFKDTSDKVGDFLQTGGGALADFFENIAPQVGVTADEFRDLSGPQALGLYVSSLEKANLSQSEMTFYMEAIASDATLLLPLLRNNSKELNRLADEAEQVGAVISDVDLQALAEIKDQINALQGAYRGLEAEIVKGAIPAIKEFTEIARDPATKEAVADLAGAVGTIAVKTSDFVVDFAALGRQFGAYAAAVTGNLSELDKLQLQLRDIDRALKGGLSTPIQYTFTSDEELKRIRDEIQSQIDRLDPPVFTTGIEGIVDELNKEFGNIDYGFDEVVKELEQEFGNIDVGLNDILGDLDTEFAEEAAERMRKAMEDYQSLVRDLRTDEEVLTDQVRERLAVLEAVGDLTDEQRNQTLGRIADAATPDAPEFSGGDTSEAQSALEDWYSTQLEMLEDFRKERADLNATWDEEELAVRQEYEERLSEITTANNEMRNQQMLDGYSAILGVVGKFYEGMEGEEAAYSRAAIAIGQTLLDEKKRNALQSIIANTQSAAMGAYDALASIPYIGPFLGAAAAGGIIVAGGLAAAEVTGLAHDGIDSIPEDGTWLLEKGERVTTAETSAKLDRTLARIDSNLEGSRRGGMGGGNTYNYNVAGDLNRETAAQAARESERKQRMTARRIGG